MRDVDISAEWVEVIADNADGHGMTGAAEALRALRAALGAAEAHRDKAISLCEKSQDRAVALTFENDILRAALDAAEARERQAVDAEPERCATIAKVTLEDEAGDLAAISDQYIHAMATGVHHGRRIDRPSAKTYATAFAERADAVNQMADHTAAAIRTGAKP